MLVEPVEEELPIELNSVPKFPLLENALDQQLQNKKQLILGKENQIKAMRKKYDEIKRSSALCKLELTHLTERKLKKSDQLTKLNGERKELEAQIRKLQSEEQKLKPANVSGTVDQLLHYSGRQIAQLEATLTETNKKISSLSLENLNVDQRIKEVEESLLIMFEDQNDKYSSLEVAKTELRDINEHLLNSSSSLKELVESERNNILTRFLSLEKEFPRTEVISKIRQKQQDWLAALDRYVEENCEVPPLNV